MLGPGPSPVPCVGRPARTTCHFTYRDVMWELYYSQSAQALALTRADLVTLARNSLLASFVTEDERRPWLQSLDAVAVS